jgi:hypothetical protein
MRQVFSIVALVGIAVSLTSCGGNSSSSIRDLSQLKNDRGILDYQIGPNWGKNAVTLNSVASESMAFQRAAKATARVNLGLGGATGFVLGERDGVMVFATNHHVIGDARGCARATISFDLLGIKGLKCKEILFTSTDLDLTLFSVKSISEENADKLLKVARSFDSAEPVKGTSIVTVGYGTAGNPGQQDLMATSDSDRKVYSPDGEARFMKDPDEFNPGPFMTWLFATGCDVSHGDSGSAMVNADNGDVIGIVSTGKIPKDPKVREESYLKQIYEDFSEDVWKELTYVVPASKIVEAAKDFLPL